MSTQMTNPRVSDGAGRSARESVPHISVVVASNRSRALLDDCLAALLDQCERAQAELIVARDDDEEGLESIALAYPTVRVVPVKRGASIPELRGAGMREATGDIVMLTEDHCVPGPQWVEELCLGVDQVADIAGGGMDNAQRKRAIDWAAYFSEYGLFATTRSDTGEGMQLTGANVAYRRSIVEDVIGWASAGEWENVAHERLRARGSSLHFVESAPVYQNKTYEFWDFCRDRYEHGRDYARTRLVEEQHARRWLLTAVTPLLPLVIVTRVARAAAPTRWGAFLRALPATLAFVSAWSVGEAVGYLRGPAERPAGTP
ncbi:MAG: glycosyl transferase family 2 [Gemmatimonadetes bacterium]|nr:glycosyl transferase family 2 [Gemmatimonadota bacterium]